MTNELQLLIEVLEKKERILRQILDKSKIQLNVAEAETLDVERFDKLVDDKASLLDEMVKLDEGFDSTYQRVKDELLTQKDKYKKEIVVLQKLIENGVDLGARISAAETRTKNKLSVSLTRSKKELVQKRVSTKVASDYYKTSNNFKHASSFFLDKKK